MTIKQFRTLSTSKQNEIIFHATLQCRRALDRIDYFAGLDYRRATDNPWGNIRSTNVKINREYDYAYATWRFLHKIKTELEQIMLENIPDDEIYLSNNYYKY